MIFHSKLFPQSPNMQYWKCGCGRTLFKANAQEITVSNDYGLPWESMNPSAKIIEIQCHSCKNKYKIIYQ